MEGRRCCVASTVCNYGYVQTREVGRPEMYSMTRAGRGRADGTGAMLLLCLILACLAGLKVRVATLVAELS